MGTDPLSEGHTEEMVIDSANEFEAKYNHLCLLLDRPNANLVTNVIPNAVTPQPIFCPLPRIQLPNFDGKIHSWSIFYQTFNGLFDNQIASPGVKLQYLRMSLNTDSLNLIQHLP